MKRRWGARPHRCLDGNVVRLEHRYAVVTYGRRDDYQVAIALHEVGALDRLFTDFYLPDALARPMKRVKWRGLQKVLARHSIELPSRVVVSGGMPRDFLQTHVRMGPGTGGMPGYETAGVLERKAGRWIARHGLGVLAYSYHWRRLEAAEGLTHRLGPAVVFQVHPEAMQIARIVRGDRARTELTYGPEPEETCTSETAGAYMRSLCHADAVITASSFTKRGLVEAGLPAERVVTVPYGFGMARNRVDSGRIPLTGSPGRRSGELRLLWVGQLAYRKAAHHLFRALRYVGSARISLTLVTRSRMPAELVPLLPARTRILTSVSDVELTELYRSHDLFVLPSLVEGFGLVYLEALANGLPVLATPNSGVPDVIENGREGIIVPAGDCPAIARAIEWSLDNPDRLHEMSRAALDTADRWQWQDFRLRCIEVLSEIERGHGSVVL